MDNLEKNLNTLAEMLKKRGNSDFKHDLRNQLIRKANELNEKPVADSVKRERFAFKIPSWFGKALVPATAGVLVLTVLVFAILPGSKLLNPISVVDIAQANDYYVLTANSEDSSGVDSASGFVLESQGEVSASDVEENLVVTPEIPVVVDQQDPNTVTIQPVEPLEAGEIYSITLEAQNIEDSPYKTEYSWAYQVTDEFRVASTIPGDKTAGVPTNNGVEITFNYNGVSADDLENYFSIEPAVSGDFESNGKYGVFMPEGLTAATIYTVTVKQGLPLSGTDKVLGDDYTFQFETGTDVYSDNNFGLSNNVYEFTPDDTPYLTGYYWDWETSGGDMLADVPAKLTVYQFASGEDYLKTLQEQDMSLPDWSWYSSYNYEIPTDGLSEVIAPSDVLLMQGYYDRAIIFPQTLSEGYYLAEAEVAGQKKQALIQIVPIGAYFSISETSSLVWVNDMTMGQPVEGAEVEFLDGDSMKTGADGVAFFDDLPYGDFVQQGNSDFTAYGYLKISYEGHAAYYGIDAYMNDESVDNVSADYWQFLKTERGTYHPTDTLNYWGFVKGRDKAVNGSAEIFITDAPWYLSMNWLSDYGTVYYKEDVDLENGGVVSGSIELEKLLPGSYGLWVVQDDNIIMNTVFSVEDYIKPAYQLIIESEENVLWNGESTNINVRAEFFDGTPAPNVGVNATKGTYYTDENGEFSITYTAEPYDCSTDELSFKSYCELFPTDYQYFYIENEEAGDIWEEERMTMIRSRIGATDIEADHDTLSFETKYVDYNKVVEEMEDHGWVWQGDEIYGANAAETEILVSIVRHDQEKIEEGTYYDYIDKVVKTNYYYQDVDVPLGKTTIYADASGKVEHNLELDENSSYTVYVTIYDADGNFYTESVYLSGSSYQYGYYESSRYMYFDITDYEKKYDVSENVELTLAEGSGTDLFSDDVAYKYLYFTSIDGINSYEISDSPTYSFTFEEEMIPSITVTPIVFDGKYFVEGGGTSVQYNYENERLNIDIIPDKDSYEPGETAEISFEITDSKSGNNADGYLNVYLVDEAYYSLYDESLMDPLAQLYGYSDSRYIYSYASHEQALMTADEGKGGCFKEGTKILMSDGSYKNIEDIVAGDLIKTRPNEFDEILVTGEVLKTYEHVVSTYISVNGGVLEVTPEHVIFLNDKWSLAENLKVGDYLINMDGEKVWVESAETINAPTKVYNFEVEKYHTYFADNIYVHNNKGGMRENFQDTALFATVEVDGGEAAVEFVLPDNITSWRVVATVVNENLKGGFNSSNVIVTKPAFVLPVLNTEYLTGDNPIIPLRVYGNELVPGDDITAGVEIEDMDYAQEQEGTAFSPIYFDLGTLAEGLYEVVSYAETDADDDAVLQEINVVASHLSADHIWDSILSENLSLEGSETERTDVTFMNNEVGPIYSALISSATDFGDRADQKASNSTARELLNKYFEEEITIYEFPLTTYQVSDYYGYNYGAIRLLPYGDGELELTARLAALNSDLWNEEALLNYFESVLNTGSAVDEYGNMTEIVFGTVSEKILAIYGASALDESYLNELDYFVTNFDLSVEDKIYAALAYLNMSDKSSSADLYLDIVGNYSDSIDGYVKITDEDALDDDELSWTALTALLAAKLGDDSHKDFWNYVTTFEGREAVNTELQSIEKTMYASAVLDFGAESEITFKLNGGKITLVNNEVFQISMTPDELANADFGAIGGEIHSVVRFTEDISLDEIETDDRVMIRRTYFVNGVETTDFNPGDLVKVEFTVKMPASTFGGYVVKDYLPSGLKPVLRYAAYFTEATSGYYSDNYRPPYQTLGQELSFFSSCGVYGEDAVETDSFCTDNFYYYARIINKGEFVTEPAIVQNYENPEIINVSGDRGSITIEGDIVASTEFGVEDFSECESQVCYEDGTCYCEDDGGVTIMDTTVYDDGGCYCENDECFCEE